MAAEFYPDTQGTLKIIHTSYMKKTGDLLILSKAHKKFISDKVEECGKGKALTLAAWLGYLWDCEDQPDWETTRLKAHRFVTNYDGCLARVDEMLRPFTIRKGAGPHNTWLYPKSGASKRLDPWHAYLLNELEFLGFKMFVEDAARRSQARRY